MAPDETTGNSIFATPINPVDSTKNPTDSTKNPTDSTKNPTDSSKNSLKYVYDVKDGDKLEFNYKLDLGTNKRSLYLVITNTDLSNSINEDVKITSNKSQKQSLSKAQFLDNNKDISFKEKPIFKDLPQVVNFKHLPFVKSPKKLANYNVSPPSSNSVGDTNTFFDEKQSKSISSTLKKVVSNVETQFGKKTLLIWVANNCWHSGGSKDNLITQDMVDKMAEKFLKSGLKNDIYDWVSTIYGEEWGDHNIGDFIEEKDEITILLYDIEDDNSTNGGVLGFFWSKDNAKISVWDSSNERIMFYIDAVMYAQPTGDSWEITDYWPMEMISTLAHEFQHMIAFYQKNIKWKNAAGLDTWINEMSSMVVQDFVANKIFADGPRGVAFTDKTSGNSGNTEGRIPRYNFYNDYQVNTWYNEDLVLTSYAMSFSLGAYLARNYGGVKLFQKIIQDSSVHHGAIENAISSLGYNGINFAEIIKRWGVSVLLSDKSAGSVYQFNKGDWFNSDVGGTSYSLGSIDFYKFKYESRDQVGPKIYQLTTENLSKKFYPASNSFYLVGKNLSGVVSLDIKLPSNKLKLQLVAKE